jgi:hypothetical protein
MDTRYTIDDSQRALMVLPGEPAPAGYGGFGAFSRSQATAAWNRANSYARATMPPPLRAAINASPMSGKQKRLLLREPLGILAVVGDYGADQAIKFINRTQSMARTRASSYRIGGRRFSLYKGKSDSLKLGASVMMVAYSHPIEAHIVAAQMALELGGATFKMLGASIGSSVAVMQQTATQAAKAAEEAARQAGKATQDIVAAGQKAADDALKAVSSWFGLGAAAGAYAGFGDAGVISGPVAALLASFGIEAGAAAALGITVETGILTAPMWLPLVMDLVGGMMPKPPTPSQKAEAKTQGEAKLKVAEEKSGKKLVKTGALDNLAASVGVSPPILIGGGVGLFALVLFATRRK